MSPAEISTYIQTLIDADTDGPLSDASMGPVDGEPGTFGVELADGGEFFVSVTAA